MVGLKISSEEIKEIIPILGLADDDQGKVYLSLLSLGTATLGQISILSGLDYLKTQEALQVLVGSKLVKRIPGKVGRYIALEPFLKSFYPADPTKRSISKIFRPDDKDGRSSTADSASRDARNGHNRKTAHPLRLPKG